jgi:hypothetical protein
MSGVPLDIVKDALDQLICTLQNMALEQSTAHKELSARVKRTETRLVRLMEYHGLDAQGQDKPTLMVSRD